MFHCCLGTYIHICRLFFLKTLYLCTVLLLFVVFLLHFSGIQIAKKIDKLGMRSSDTAQIFFEDVRVPCKNLIGEEGKGFTYQMLQFQEERLWGVATGKSSLALLQPGRDTGVSLLMTNSTFLAL